MVGARAGRVPAAAAAAAAVLIVAACVFSSLARAAAAAEVVGGAAQGNTERISGERAVLLHPIRSTCWVVRMLACGL